MVEDVEGISLRDWEREEIRGLDYKKAVQDSMARSDETIAVSVEGKLCLLVGHFAHSMFAGSGNAWMFATPEAEKHKVTMARFSRRIVNLLSDIYPAVYVATYPGNTVAVKWLEWLGFKAAEKQVSPFTLTMVKH